MKDVLPKLSPELRKKAYLYRTEAAWPRALALAVVDRLTELHLAVLGGEVWLPGEETEFGTEPVIPVGYDNYTWDCDERRPNEDWDAFTARANQQARDFIQAFAWDPKDTKNEPEKPFFNLTPISASEYAEFATAEGDEDERA